MQNKLCEVELLTLKVLMRIVDERMDGCLFNWFSSSQSGMLRAHFTQTKVD